jgi:hypothetical protein
VRWKAILPAVAVLAGFLASCAAPLLTPDERKQVCHVAVKEKFSAPEFRPNPLSSPAGGLAGAGAGALMGLQGGPLAILPVPIGAVVGAASGAVCAAAGIDHPTADADFQGLLRACDIGVLAGTVETALNAPRSECIPGPGADATPAQHDSVVEIEKIQMGMGCLYGQMEYGIAVEWRTVNLRSGKELNSTATRCAVKSFHDVDAWFADRGRAQAEIESALAATGRRMALQLLTQDVLRGECRLQANEAGEIKAP